MIAPVVTHYHGATVVAQADASSALAGTMLFVRAGLDRQSFAQNGLAALTAETVLQTPVDGVRLRDAVDAAGGSIGYVVDRDAVRFYVEGLGADEPALLRRFAAALRAPDFSVQTVALARAALLRTIGGSNALGVGLQMLDGAQESGTAVSLAQFVPDDVRAFYARSYRIGGSVVSAAGALQPGASYESLVDALAPGASTPMMEKIPALGGTSHQLVAHRDIEVPWLVARYRAPAFDSRDFGAMLVLSSFVDRTLQAVAQVPTLVTRTSADSAVGSIYAFSPDDANLTVYLYGGLGEPAQAFSTALAVFKAVGRAPITGSLEGFKADARGRFARDVDRVEDRAWIAGVFAAGGGSAEYLGRTFAAIDATTAADVRRVAKRYLADPTVAFVLPRQGP